MQDLETKLSKLTIQVDASVARLPGLSIRRDGIAVGPGAWGTASPADPGEHVVEATAGGKRPWRASVTLGAQGDAKTVVVAALEDEAAAAAAPMAPAPSVAGTPPPDVGVPAEEGHPLRTVGLVVGGAGILGLGVSGFFALRAKGLSNESNEGDHCNPQNECDAVGGAKRDDAKSAATVATVALIAGGVLTATGVTLFLVGGPKKDSAIRVQATPVVGWNAAAMVVGGRF